MTVIGFRLSTKEYHFAVVSGDYFSPIIDHVETIKIPKGFERPAVLSWLYDEIQTIVDTHRPSAIYVRGMEPAANRQSQSATDRIENETIVFLVAEKMGLATSSRVVDGTIASRLQLGQRDKRRLCYESCTEKFGRDFPDPMKDAVLTAWIRLPD